MALTVYPISRYQNLFTPEDLSEYYSIYADISTFILDSVLCKPNRNYSKFIHNNKIFISFYANAHLWVIALLDFQYLYYTTHTIQYSSSNQVIHFTKREDNEYYVVFATRNLFMTRDQLEYIAVETVGSLPPIHLE